MVPFSVHVGSEVISPPSQLWASVSEVWHLEQILVCSLPSFSVQSPKECVRNHRSGTSSEDLDESMDIVEEMIVDCLYGSDPEYRDIFDEEDDEDDVDGMDKEEDPDDSFRSCVDRYIEHLKECCIYDEDLCCIGCGLCDHGPILRLLMEYSDVDSDDDPDNPCNGCCGESCRGCRASNLDEEDTIPRFEVVEGRLIITFVGRDGDA